MEITNIWYEYEHWSEEVDELDCNSDVIFELNDGSKWCATFFTYQNLLSLSKKNHMTGENLSGKYFYADKPIFISRMDKATIIAVIQDIVQMNEIESAFLKLNQGE